MFHTAGLKATSHNATQRACLSPAVTATHQSVVHGLKVACHEPPQIYPSRLATNNNNSLPSSVGFTQRVSEGDTTSPPHHDSDSA
ncbi:hypothetical protein E2C01_056442 [Portunus trituberculatus]|uniref:Uncharacterized protein n=1 Tax=Portunus trituberculatus TaxID=210409 RepID=A0A5B7GZM5_PORTR|nr:hypothetical protein [Portunus trituberculatus]